jgi:hypothetical protein
MHSFSDNVENMENEEGHVRHICKMDLDPKDRKYL